MEPTSTRASSLAKKLKLDRFINGLSALMSRIACTLIRSNIASSFRFAFLVLPEGIAAKISTRSKLLLDYAAYLSVFAK